MIHILDNRFLGISLYSCKGMTMLSRNPRNLCRERGRVKIVTHCLIDIDQDDDVCIIALKHKYDF